MDPTTIREIIEAVQTLGGDAQEAFVWYLATAYLPSFVLGLIWTAIGACVLWKALGLVRLVLHGEELRKAARVCGSFNSSELRRACDVLKEHYP